MLSMLLVCRVEIQNSLGISTALVPSTAELHSQRSGHQEAEGAAPGRRGHSSPVQLARAAEHHCCTSTAWLLAQRQIILLRPSQSQFI